MTNQYDTIYASMNATIQSIRALAKQHGATRAALFPQLSAYLREYKTYGFRIPRECDTSIWVSQHLLDIPDSYLFAQSPEQGHYIATYGRRQEWLPELGAAERKRILTWRQLEGYINDSRALPHPPRLIIIQDAGVCFDKIRINKFYEWLASHPGVDRNTEIILMN